MPSVTDMKAAYRRLAARTPGKPAVTRFAMPAGAAADTNIAVTGIKRGTSQLLAVLGLQENTAGAYAQNAVIGSTDRLATTSITSDGNIQCTASTATERLLVVWMDTD